MQTFIEQVVQQVLTKHKSKNLVFVVTGARAAQKLKNAVLQNIRETTFLPQFITLNSFIEEQQPLIVPDKMLLVAELYKAYSLKIGNEPDSFDTFYSWGVTLLTEYDEVVRQLADTSQVFSNLADFKLLEEWGEIDWSFAEELTGDKQQQFNLFWEKLPEIFSQFEKQLLEKGWTTSAASQKYVANKYSVEECLLPSTKHYIFVGFNALSKAENHIIEKLISWEKASAYWDVSVSYFPNKQSEAGKFISKIETKEGHIFIYPPTREASLPINLYEGSKQLGQIHSAAQILSDFPANKLRETAVVLTNEQLLTPFLNALPDNVKEANVTMGLPIKSLALYSLLEQILNVGLTEANSFKNKEYIQQILNSSTYLKCEKHLAENKITSYFFPKFFKGNKEILIHLRGLVTFLKQFHNSESKEAFFLQCIEETTNKLELLLTQLKLDISCENTVSFFLNYLNEYKFDLLGEPLQGLQIMGMLETRALDFKHIILIGANEGSLPPSVNEFGIIPFDIKHYFGLPLPDEKQAIYAYYFMRLLNRCDEMHLVYNSISEGSSLSEPSHYIEQLKNYELENPNTYTFQKFNTGIVVENFTNSTRLYQTSKTVQEKLLGYFERGISASFINGFFDCKRDFFINRILGIKEEDSTDEVSAAEFGSIVHKVLEDAFHPFIGEFLTDKHYKQIEGKLEALLKKSFEEHLPNKNFKNGETALFYSIAKEQLVQLLLNDKKRIQFFEKQNTPIQLVSLEQKIDSVQIGEIEHNGKKHPVKLTGYIDRIEKFSNTIQIIDYKSGKVIEADLKLEDLDAEALAKKPKLLQLFIYMLGYTNSGNFNLKGGMLSMRFPTSGVITAQLGKKPDLKADFSMEDTSEFKQIILNIAQEILTTETFEHEGSTFNSFCSYCS